MQEMGNRSGLGPAGARLWWRWLAVVVAGYCSSIALPWAWASPGPATNDEYALLVLINQLRSDPSAQGYSDPVAPPLVWNDGLAAAARAHSDDMSAHGCFGHNSCNGQSWVARITQYYSGWVAIGEDIAGIATAPEDYYAIWVSSAEHRANMLNAEYLDFGGGLTIPTSGTAYGTVDFGARGLRAVNAVPGIPAAAVLPRAGTGSESRQFLASYYHYNGKAPKSVHALVGSSCISLSHVSGAANYGTYGATHGVPGNGCLPVVFEAVRSDGAVERFPASDSLVVGVGSSASNCPERSSTPPSASCGSDPLPTPTPTPTGSGSATLTQTQVVIHPGKKAGKDQLRLAALIDPLPTFAPSANGVQIAVQYPGGRWSVTLPAQCADGPCLAPNKRLTAYRSDYGGKSPHVSLVTDRSHTHWKLRLSAAGLTLARPTGAGEVDVIAGVGGQTAGATTSGNWHRTSFIAK